MRKLTFNDLPEAISEILGRLEQLEAVVSSNSEAVGSKNSVKWLSLNDLCNYLPSHPSKSTIYQKVSRREIPFNKDGSRLIFQKSKIDQWLQSNSYPSKNEIEQHIDSVMAKTNN